MNWSTVQPGELTKLVTLIQRSPAAPNEVGGGPPTNTTIGQVYASIRPVSSREVDANADTGQQITHTIVVWYTDQLTHADAIQYGDRTFEIQDIRTLREENRQMLITCIENVA